MKRTIALLCFLLPVLAFAQTDSMRSGMYQWKEPAGDSPSVLLFEGKVHDMEWLQLRANAIPASGAKLPVQVPATEEQLLIIKSGRLSVVLRDTAYDLGAGSVVLLMPNEKLSLQNSSNQPCQFYQMRYRSKQPADAARGRTAGDSQVINWDKTTYKPHDKGGRRDFFERPTAMCRRLEMHVSTLNQGLKSHDPHTHRAEEIVLVTVGNTRMQIGEAFYSGSAGSVYYLGSNVPHAIQNEGSIPCTYFAFQFE